MLGVERGYATKEQLGLNVSTSWSDSFIYLSIENKSIILAKEVNNSGPLYIGLKNFNGETVWYNCTKEAIPAAE